MNVMVIVAIAIYLKTTIHWVCSKLAVTTFHVCLDILLYILKDRVTLSLNDKYFTLVDECAAFVD